MFGQVLTRTASIAAIVVLAALATAVGVEHHRLTTVQRDNAQLALAHTNDLALVDSTRHVSATNATLAHALGDSLTMTQRLVVQVEQQADAVDKALQLERRGRYAMAVGVDSLRRTGANAIASSGAVTEDSSAARGDTARVRRASFDVRQAPYTVTAAVELPAPPDTAHLDLRIALDPIPVTARLSCAPPNAHGIRAASIEAQTPAWASVKFDAVEQSPDLCASPALTKASAHGWIRPAIIAGIGKVASRADHWAWGGFVGVGFAVPIGG